MIRSTMIPFVVLALLSASSFAQSYPGKPVRVITPWPSGGLTDVAGRIVFQKVSENLGQQFLIDNRPGATGSIGADLVAKSPPDGYTLMVHSMAHLGNPYIYPKLPYDTLGDFIGVGTLVRQTGLLVVHPSLPVKSVKELVALAKARPDQILYATSGSGSFSHFAFVLLASMTSTKLVHVPYKGGGPATTALVSGETQMLIGSPAAVASQLAAGRLRLLAVTSDTRLTAFAKTPTVAEAGVPGYEYTGWVGVFAPKGTSPAIVDRMNGELKKAIESPDTQKRMAELEPYTMTPQQMAARIKTDYEKYGKLLKLVGGKID
ncbi:MAG TPA: tripartite tricarboxylate transporter substrate binding protein [Burkholderiales bacterium]|nr:tripartite tricarboxylate transporter substrate binding protein [Burkholderiales bacterium]